MSCFGNLEAQVTNRIHLEQGLLPIPQAKYCVRFFSDIQRLPSQTNIAMRHKPVEAPLPGVRERHCNLETRTLGRGTGIWGGDGWRRRYDS